MKKILVAALCVSLFAISCDDSKTSPPANQEQTAINSPDDALAELKAGNQRFLEGKSIHTNYKEQIEQTKSGQHPHSMILSCMDSRVPPEIIFDNGIGNIFSTRVAGNIENADILGSMEYAVAVVGTKLIVVMGHNHCGAIKGAVDHVELGNLTQLLVQIQPSITGDSTNKEAMVDATAKKNVQMTIDNILKGSSIINNLVNEKKVKIVGALYDITTGKVNFYD